MVPMGTTSEEVEVQLPQGVKIVETEGFSKAFEYEGDITASVLNKYNGDGWPRPYLRKLSRRHARLHARTGALHAWKNKNERRSLWKSLWTN